LAYIYKIENLINHKVYIGKTLYSIEKRWLEHLKDSQGSKNENRPLYKAMKKYGCSNFFIEELEKCSAEESSDKERFWISVYDSYYNGYNATLGGDGKQYADYDLIHKLYVEGYKYEEITNFTGYDRLTIATALDNYGIFKEERAKIATARECKKVARLDKKTGEILEILPSAAEADRKYSTGKHVAQVCNGKRKSAGGYGWKYV
jgi:group I intron endonuclease